MSVFIYDVRNYDPQEYSIRPELRSQSQVTTYYLAIL